MAEFGSLHLEFQYLTFLTGDRKYLDKVAVVVVVVLLVIFVCYCCCLLAVLFVFILRDDHVLTNCIHIQVYT